MQIKRFKNSLSENVFRYKYSQGPNDNWDALADRLVEDVCGSRWGTTNKLMSDGDRQQLSEYIKQQKFLPGGRYLYYAGRQAKYYNNCLIGSTRILTDQGWRRADDLGTANVLSPVDGKYYPAEFKSRGKQMLNKITFSNLRGNQAHTWEVFATRQHHWPLIDGTDTYDLRVGDVVPANQQSAGFDGLGFVHGFVFGDGNSNGQLRLCAEKDKKHLKLLSEFGTVSYPPSASGDPVVYFKHKIDWKNTPTNESPAYIASFILGWLAADGSETAGNKLCSVNKEALEWFRDHAAYAGLVVTGALRSQVRNVAIGDYSYQDHTIYVQNYQYGGDFAGFKVINIEPFEEQEVYCPYEPVHHRIIIDHNIDTFQCYLLRAEEDTREEWSNVTWRAMSCLMTGGGIGIDYSRLRASGKPLSRTGGLASGPIPLMYAINEIGRNVMQGGSRRSAIYASLNWQHEDIPLFLKAKNWHDQVIYPEDNKVAIGSITHWDAKQVNFNHNAPLDMTNISVNYDDAAFEAGNPYVGKFKADNPVFLENCRQAMMTGEPGFSFNFGDKENETLRNAPLGPDTYVLTIDGYKQIRDIVGTTVSIWTGKQWANTVFNKTMENAPVVKVLMSGGREIVAEPSHEFFLEDGTKRPAKDLQEGDNLLIQLNNEVDSFLCKKYYSLGYIYGDGTFHRAYPRAEVTFCTDESRNCFENFDMSLLTSWNFSDSRGYLRAYTKNNDLFAYRNKAVFPEDLFGQPAAEQCSFLAGLFDADGNYVAERGTVRVASKHVEFLHGVRRLLESLGILSGISTAGVSTYGESQGHMLTVYSEYTSRFAEIIPTKRLKVKDYDSYRKAKIKVISVEDAGYSDVFCCDVGVPEHSFMAEGIIVSNCTEVTSEDDSDVCNLGSINLGNIETLEEFKAVVHLASKFLLCGTLRADLPYEKVYKVREKNRRLGLGLMGIHEWLLKRNFKYEVNEELHKWLAVYRDESERSANEHADRLFISRPVAYRAIAPTGSIGILAATTTGIEPLYAVAYKRRFLTEGTRWKYQYVVDSTAEQLIRDYGLDPNAIETASDLAADPERRIKFQADVQDYVDMSISSTINLPQWGSELNNEDKVQGFAQTLAKYAPRLRGFTCYPDLSRGGQPITKVDYEEASKNKDTIFEEHDVCSITGKGGVCGV